MNEELRGLRERLVRTAVNRRGQRKYEEGLRRDIASYATRRHSHGDSYSEIAKTLGLPSATLLHWQKKAKQRPSAMKRTVGFRPVALRAEPSKIPVQPNIKHTADNPKRSAVLPASQPVMVLPGGVRIEGLAVGDLAELVRSLGCLP